MHVIRAIAVDDDGYQSGTARVDINVTNGPLTLDASIPEKGYPGELKHFFAYASGGVPPYEWVWDFGDGTGSLDNDPVHAYQNPGTYEVTVTLTDQADTEVRRNSFNWQLSC
jgi:PKD repeat protein